ncbi:MAG: DUF1127 domain-containing protein [Pseudomonadota bacterium]
MLFDIISVFKEDQAKAEAVHAFEHLSDQELQDMGLHRSQIEAFVDETVLVEDECGSECHL